MRRIVFISCLVTCLFSHSGVETRVLQKVKEMMAREGRVTFSDLYNGEFTVQEKAFLGRLYEIFFQIPAFLKREHQSTGEIPKRLHVAIEFGISQDSVDLLLAVMESDRRIPSLFTRNLQSREIEALEVTNIDAFVRSHGSQVKVTQWADKRLPSFDLAAFDGKRIRSSDLVGSHVLIYFWFTGCPPCTRISPLLADLNRQYASSNFRVIGLNADTILGLSTTVEERGRYLKKVGVDFTNAHLDNATQQAFGMVNVFPTLFLVGADGVISQHFINYQDRETLEGAVAALVQSAGGERQKGPE